MKLLLTITFVVFCLCCCNGWSTFDKNKITYYRKTNSAVEECQDIFATSVCEDFKDKCFKVKKVTKLCKKTCNDCRAISPLSCKASKFGCCWDNITTSEDAFGKGCSQCIDRKGDCDKLKSQCGLAHVRRVCPTTCNVDCKVGREPCVDDKGQAPYCPLFRDANFCKLDPSLMKQYCKRTCNLCGPGYPKVPNTPSPNTVESDDNKKSDVNNKKGDAKADAVNDEELVIEAKRVEESLENDQQEKASLSDSVATDTISDADFVKSLTALLDVVKNDKKV